MASRWCQHLISTIGMAFLFDVPIGFLFGRRLQRDGPALGDRAEENLRWVRREAHSRERCTLM